MSSTIQTSDTSNFSYYYFDYNPAFDASVAANNVRTGNFYGFNNNGGDSTESHGYNAYFEIFTDSSTGIYSGFQKAHYAFTWGGYTNNGTQNGNQSSITNNNSNAGNYGFILLFANSTTTPADNFISSTNYYILSDNYTFGNNTKNLNSLLLSRKDSNAFTFDTANFGPYGQTAIDDKTNARWGYSDLKMVAKCDIGTFNVKELYFLNGTNVILSLATDSTNMLVLKNGSFWTADTDGSFFNSVNIPVSAGPSILVATSLEETAAIDSGISTADIDVLKTGTFTITDGKATLDDIRKAKLLEILQQATNTTDKRTKRLTALKLFFSTI